MRRSSGSTASAARRLVLTEYYDGRKRAPGRIVVALPAAAGRFAALHSFMPAGSGVIRSGGFCGTAGRSRDSGGHGAV